MIIIAIWIGNYAVYFEYVGAIDARFADGIMWGDSFVADGNCSMIIIGSLEQHLWIGIKFIGGVECDFLPRVRIIFINLIIILVFLRFLGN